MTSKWKFYYKKNLPASLWYHRRFYEGQEYVVELLEMRELCDVCAINVKFLEINFAGLTFTFVFSNV